MASEVCASIPHPWLSVYVYRCDHRGDVTVHVSHGPDCSTADRDYQYEELVFGPLEPAEGVRQGILRAVAELLDQVVYD